MTLFVKIRTKTGSGYLIEKNLKKTNALNYTEDIFEALNNALQVTVDFNFKLVPFKGTVSQEKCEF